MAADSMAADSAVTGPLRVQSGRFTSLRSRLPFTKRQNLRKSLHLSQNISKNALGWVR